MSGIRGDFGKLNKLIVKVEGLTKPQFKRELAKNVSAEAIELVREEFETGTGPYGEAWPAPKIRKAGGGGSIIPLNAAGNLKNSFHIAEYTPFRFIIETNIFYASVHQYGKIIRAKNWRTVTYRVDTSKLMARKLARIGERVGLTKAAIRAALKAQYANGGRYVTVTVKRFGLVFRGVTTTSRDYVGKDGKQRRSTRRNYGGWITKLEVKIPRRQIIPETILPQKWVEAFRAVAKEVIDDHFDK